MKGNSNKLFFTFADIPFYSVSLICAIRRIGV